MTDYAKLLKNIFDVYGAVSTRLPSGYALPPLHYYLLVTDRCNLRCKMCHYIEHFDRHGKASELTTEELENVIRQIPSYALVTFSGGEPLVRKDIIGLMSSAARGHKLHLITNGTMLTEDKAAELAGIGARSLLGKGLVMAGISLEGGPAVHDPITNRPGSYDKTVAGIGNLIRARDRLGRKFPLTHLTVVIGEGNYGELAEMYRLAEGLGVDVCNYVIKNMADFAAYLYDGGGPTGLGTAPPDVDYIPEEELRAQFERIAGMARGKRTQLRFSPLPRKEFYRYYTRTLSLGDYTCRYPWLKMGIFADGEVFGCHYLKMGNVKTQRLTEIWNGGPYRGFRKELGRDGIYPGCMGCCYMEYNGGEDI